MYEFLYEAHYSHTSQIEKVPPKHKMKQTHVIATKVFFLKKKKKENCANNSKNKKEKKMKRSDKVHMTMKQEMTKTQKYLRPENSCRKQMNRVFKKTRSLLCSIICYWKKATTT